MLEAGRWRRGSPSAPLVPGDACASPKAFHSLRTDQNLLDTGCRVDFAATHSKQSIGVPSTRHCNRGGNRPLSARDSHCFPHQGARLRWQKMKPAAGAPD